MSINELAYRLGQYNLEVLIGCIALPIFIWLYGVLIAKRKANVSPHKFIYSFFVYTVSIPGILSIILLLYAVFIMHVNLLEVNLVLYVLPAIVMVISMVIIKNAVDIHAIPGFDRLRGLYMIIAATFILTLILMKMRIFIFFGGSIGSLFIFFIVLFIILKIGSKALFKKRR